MNGCTFCWGSHGCDKSFGHVTAGDPVHQCGFDVYEVGQVDSDPHASHAAHSRYDESNGMVITGLWGDNDEFLGWAEPEPMRAIGHMGG